MKSKVLLVLVLFAFSTSIFATDALSEKERKNAGESVKKENVATSSDALFSYDTEKIDSEFAELDELESYVLNQ